MSRPPKVQSMKTGIRTKAHNENEKNSTPIFESQEFIAPPDLSEKELECWNWLTGIYRGMTNCYVCDADVQLMAMYCRAKVAADEADAELKKDGRAYIIIAVGKDKDGNVKTSARPNPNIKKRHDNMLLCLKYFDQLGLSPLARARAGVKAANSKDDKSLFADLMRRHD